MVNKELNMEIYTSRLIMTRCHEPTAFGKTVIEIRVKAKDLKWIRGRVV